MVPPSVIIRLQVMIKSVLSGSVPLGPSGYICACPVPESQSCSSNRWLYVETWVHEWSMTSNWVLLPNPCTCACTSAHSAILWGKSAVPLDVCQVTWKYAKISGGLLLPLEVAANASKNLVNAVEISQHPWKMKIPVISLEVKQKLWKSDNTSNSPMMLLKVRQCPWKAANIPGS